MTRLRLGALLGAIMALAAGSTALVFALPAAASASASSRSFWVSPNGRSSATGTRGDPFATLQQARDAVRAVSHVRGDIVVNIENGTYRLSRPLSFTSRDSGRGGRDVVYRAAPGAHPIISGARSVPGRDWAVQNATLNIWRAHVGDVATQQLYVDGERATLAQTTASPVGFLPHWVKDPTVSGIQYQVTSLNPARWADPTAWSAPGDVEAVIDTQWKTMIVPVSSVTAPVPGAPGLLTMQQPAWDNANVFVDAKTQMPGIWSFWQVTRFQNAYEFLDSPGEWYLDRAAGDLFYIPLPGQRMDNAKVELPVLETLVRADGSATRPVAHLRIEGLTFTGATWLAPASRDGYVSDQSG
ncbi:MAG TPA: carbohydrate-binding protein, partial [Acidimicrobiia bacterium]